MVNPTPCRVISCAKAGTCETGNPVVRDIGSVTGVLVAVLLAVLLDVPGILSSIPPIIPSMATRAMMATIKIVLLVFDSSFLGFDEVDLPKDDPPISLLPHSSQKTASRALLWPHFSHFKVKTP